LTTLFVDRFDFDGCIAHLRDKNITRVVHLNNQAVVDLLAGADLDLKQTRDFIQRVETVTKATLVRG
jgi:hypothetical protein